MWTCNEIRQRSTAYFANELSGSENQQLEQHLTGCSKCRLELSEAYSGYRVASAAFKAPDAERGLNAARLGAVYAAAAGGPTAVSAAVSQNDGRRNWFAVAACLVIAAAAWLGAPVHEVRVDVPVIAVANEAAAPAATPAQTPPAASPVADYPASYGLIYPVDYRAAGGYTPDNQYATVMIDYDSVWDQSIFIYDPAYGMGRTVVSDGSRVMPNPVMVEYGLGGPRGQLRL